MRLQYDELTGMTVPREWLKYDMERLEAMVATTPLMSNTPRSEVIKWAEKRILALRVENLIEPSKT